MENNKEDLQEVIRRMEKKIISMEEVINKINHQLNPPWWKIVLKFILNNFFTILTLISLIIIYWKFWELYQTLMIQLKSLNGSINTVKSIPQNAGNTILNIIESVGF